MITLFSILSHSYIIEMGDQTSQLAINITEFTTIYECRFHDFRASAIYVEQTHSLQQLFINYTSFTRCDSANGTVLLDCLPVYIQFYAACFDHCTSDYRGALVNLYLTGVSKYQQKHSFEYIPALSCSAQTVSYTTIVQLKLLIPQNFIVLHQGLICHTVQKQVRTEIQV